MHHANQTPASQILAYSTPALGVGFSFFILTTYLMKFGTDVLLIAPATLAAMFAAAKIWDAVTDPAIGYISDRTRSRFGRRRIWILVAAGPLALSFFFMWNPPASLEGASLNLWMGVMLIAYFTALTLFYVPHEAWGAELSKDHHDRTRVFGWKHAVTYTGNLLALVALYLMTQAEDQREMAFWLMLPIAIFIFFSMVIPTLRLEERQEYQDRGENNIYKAFRDVFSNPHARLIVLVFFIENLGGAAIGALAAYVFEYIVKMPELLSVFFLLYIVPALVTVPFWIRLSARFGKKNLWLVSMFCMAVSFSCLFFVGENDWELLFLIGCIAGMGAGCGNVVGPSIKADIIDVDELQTGQRKEGAYFAVWNFVRKFAHGLMIIGAGLLLDLSGFVPNVEQTEATKTAMSAMIGLIPGFCYLVGTIVFTRFSLDEKQWQKVRSQLDATA